jgi:ribosomal protein S8
MLNQKYKRSFYHLLSLINKAYEKNNTTLFFKNNGLHNKKILSLLLAEGFIISFKEYDNLLVIKLKASSGSKNIISSSITDLQNKACTVKELVANQRREGKAVFRIINTDAGLITSICAIEKNKGGKVIAKLC